MWWRITPIFDTVTVTIADMVIVEHVSDIPNLSNFLPVGRVWCIQSIVLTESDGLTVTRWYFNVFYVSVDKMEYRIYKKAISGFPVSPGSVETPVRWGGKITQLLIAYFLGNISAKNYPNPFICVIVIVCNISVVFLDTVYITLHFVSSDFYTADVFYHSLLYILCSRYI